MSPSMSPVLYVPHGGGPMPLLGEPSHQALVQFLQCIPQQLGTPRAILLISAHWETAQPTLTSAARPALFYDYYGFPPESYSIQYPAPGAPLLAQRVQNLLQAPHARYNHPREEHLLPLHVCLGAASGTSIQAETVFHDTVLGKMVSAWLWR